MRACSLASLLVACLGCGPPYHYPLDGELRLEHLQARGSHNSYHVETTMGRVPEWRYTMPSLGTQVGEGGVRQIELDVSLDRDIGYFEVFHVPLIDEGTTCRRFTDCLAALKQWSDRFPAHHPLYVQIEPKDGFTLETAESYFQALEDEIRSVWPDGRIVTPARVKGEAPSLRAALLERGWPTLGALRGQVFFALDAGGALRSAYTHGGNDLSGRLLFVDSAPADPFAAVAVLNDPVADGAAIGAAVAARLLVRTRADTDGEEARRGDRSRMAAALASGAHFISSDFVAKMPGLDYVLEVPGGTPSRCNPVTAPKICTSQALEDPAFGGGP